VNDCPQDVIAGTTFFKMYKGDRSFRKNRLTLDNPRTGEAMHVHFDTTSIQLIAEKAMTIAPRTEVQIPNIPTLAEARWSNLAEEERWETVSDTRTKLFKIANGVMPVREKESKRRP
jgi:hypothetical protein